jgi:hypothetical protein
LESSFDDWKADGVIFAVSEEVSLRDKKSAANRLKAMASMEVQQINPKGKPAYETGQTKCNENNDMHMYVPTVPTCPYCF